MGCGLVVVAPLHCGGVPQEGVDPSLRAVAELLVGSSLRGGDAWARVVVPWVAHPPSSKHDRILEVPVRVRLLHDPLLQAGVDVAVRVGSRDPVWTEVA